MEAAKKETAIAPPYVAFRTLKNFLHGLKPAIPSRIDKSVMPSMSGGAQAQVLAALKYLKLTDGSGTPQPALVRLVKSEGADYQKAWRDVLESAYPFIAQKQIDLETATAHQLDEQFDKLASGDTVRKCVTFFIPAIKEAGYKVSPYFKDLGKRSPNGKARKPRAKTKAQDANANELSDGVQKPPAGITPPANMSWHEMLLAKFPSFDPNWPDDVKAKWFSSFNDLMQKGAK